MMLTVHERERAWLRNFKRLWCKRCQRFRSYWMDAGTTLSCDGCGRRLIAVLIPDAEQVAVQDDFPF